jgi:putative ATPase
LLPFVESGLITLIGATTENPSFTINNALLSRCKILVFKPLSEQNIIQFFSQNKDKIKQHFPQVVLTDEIVSFIAGLSNGDLRNACNILESAIMLSSDGILNKDIIQQAFGKPMYYDRD